MTIKVTKPSINLREKLSELDFDKVPFQKMPAGSVLQVVSEIDTSAYISTSSTSFVTTGFSVSMSPSSATSKVLIMVGLNTDIDVGNPIFTLYRDGVNICPPTVHDGFAYGDSTTNDRILLPFYFSYLDAPASIEKETYELYWRTNLSGNIRYRSDISPATITLMEIAQ